MERKYLTIMSGVMAIVVAFISFNSYASTTSAAVAGEPTANIFITLISLLIACALFARYFKLIK
jgi:hypothetical protein